VTRADVDYEKILRKIFGPWGRSLQAGEDATIIIMRCMVGISRKKLDGKREGNGIDRKEVRRRSRGKPTQIIYVQ
jgi:hypothetical protein